MAVPCNTKIHVIKQAQHHLIELGLVSYIHSSWITQSPRKSPVRHGPILHADQTPTNNLNLSGNATMPMGARIKKSLQCLYTRFESRFIIYLVDTGSCQRRYFEALSDSHASIDRCLILVKATIAVSVAWSVLRFRPRGPEVDDKDGMCPLTSYVQSQTLCT